MPRGLRRSVLHLRGKRWMASHQIPSRMLNEMVAFPQTNNPEQPMLLIHFVMTLHPIFTLTVFDSAPVVL